MNFIKILLFIFMVYLCACGSAIPAKTSCTAASFSATSMPNVGIAGSSANVMPVTVNGALCGSSSAQYANKPCTSVTVCSPNNPESCQTINNILLDTGSSGLRLFSSVLNVSLTPITSGSENLAECVQFGDGSSEWGQVEYAYIQLGNEPAVHQPILVINSSYATPPALCSSSQSIPDTGPQQAGFNGILGVGGFAQDCGSVCVRTANNGQYYSCNGTNCSCGATVALAAQIQNPVSLLPSDNNGVLLALPAVNSLSGVTSLSGNLYLGIGTQSNNTPSGVTTYLANASGNIATVFSAFSSSAMPSFIDSGSSEYFLPSPIGGQLPDCSVSYGAGWQGSDCPSTVQSFTAVNSGVIGSSSGIVSFQIGNAYTLLNSSNSVFNDIASNISVTTLSGSGINYFDWGLPFFFGKNVYVGFEGATSSLGSGMYWAY